MHLRQHGDQADTGHGHRHARKHAGQYKSASARNLEQLGVGVCHPADLFLNALELAIRNDQGKIHTVRM